MNGMKNEDLINEEAAAHRSYELEAKAREDEAKRKDEEAKLRYKDGDLDDVTQDERRAAARVAAVEEKRKANEKANQEVAKKEADRKAALKPGQAEFELLLEGLRTRITAMQLNTAETAKFSATIDLLKATSGYVAVPTTVTPTYEAKLSEPWKPVNP